MDNKKSVLGGLVDDALSSIDSSDQKSVRKGGEHLTESSHATKKEDVLKKQSGIANPIKWFSELTNKDIAVAGGKGASLGEMYQYKFPVPAGFVVTAQSFDYFITQSGIKEKIKEMLEQLDRDDTQALHKASKEIRALIEKQEMPRGLQEEIIESYHVLGGEKIDGRGVNQSALQILKNAQEPVFVSVRSSATTEDLADASFAGQQESFLNVKGDANLIHYVKRCFSSLYTPRAIFYRSKKGFSEGEALLAVVVQKMIDSDKSGVVFSKNPVRSDESIAIEAVFGLGEGIVSGMIKPDSYTVDKHLKIEKVTIADKKVAVVRTGSGDNGIAKLSTERSRQQVLTNGEILEVAHYAQKLEQHYGKPQDIEFAVEMSKVYILQSRPITTVHLDEHTKKLEGTVLVEGLGASPGVGVGVVRIISNMQDLEKIKQGDVLVTQMTNPDMVVGMQKSVAIVTDEGGLTSHASIVSREMGIPCVVGSGNATKVLQEGMKVTVDGSSGKVYEGAIGETSVSEIKQALKTTPVALKVIVDLPDFAQRAAESGIDSVGLMRLEGIIASFSKHPLYYEKYKKLHEYQSLLASGIDKIVKHFKQVWIRASDIRTDEYGSLEGAPAREINPMLGLHGVRFSLKHPEILRAELAAVSAVAKKNPDKKIGIMFPQIISIEEVKACKRYFDEIKTNNLEFGVMIETPAAVQIIEDICNFVDFVSFGTNDLTQYTLAVDRGEDGVQYLYNELHPAVLSQIKHVIGICKQKGVTSSICGQAGSNKEMVSFLVNAGIDSISVNADAAYAISLLLNELEKNVGEKKEDGAPEVISSPKVDTSSLEAQERKRLKNKLRKMKRKERARQLQSSGWDKKGSFGFGGTGTHEKKYSSLLNKEAIAIHAQRADVDTLEFEPDIGPIEPFDDLHRIAREGKTIHDAVARENAAAVLAHEKTVDKIETQVADIDADEAKEKKYLEELSEILERSEGKDFEKDFN